MIKLIIFDLDGPILDSWPRTRKSVVGAVKNLGKKVPSKETFIKSYGYPGLKTARLLLSNFKKSEMESVINHWRKNELKGRISLVKGTLKVLKILKKKNYFIALLTSRFHNLKFHLGDHDIDKLFDVVQSWAPLTNNSYFQNPERIHNGHIFCNHHKPNPKVLNPILKWAAKKGISKKEIVMIDDALVGLEAARKANLRFLGVCTGPLGSKRLWQRYGNLDRKYVIKSIAELPQWLEKYDVGM